MFADMGGRWKTRIDLLMKDADAGISRPKPIAPTDYTRTNSEVDHQGHGHAAAGHIHGQARGIGIKLRRWRPPQPRQTRRPACPCE